MKPTILLGAGTALEIGAPSTNDITQEIVKPNRYINYSVTDVYGRNPYFMTISRVYGLLKEKYPYNPNFEQVFHVLEMLEAYNWTWSWNSSNKRMSPTFAPFVVPVANVVPHNEWDNLSSLINQCQISIIEMIKVYDDLYEKNKDADFQWYRNFWTIFKEFNLFNLNYDTTVEQSLPNYCDGFVDSDDLRFKKFNPKDLYNEDCPYKICHLHGCILYFNQRYDDKNHDVYEYEHNDMYKWKDYSAVDVARRNSLGSNPSNQSGETLHIGSIITGLRKTDKVTITPYNYYHHFLNQSILDNRSLLVVGYSFGDLYINDLIERMNLLYGKDKRIVIITYWKYDQIKENDGTITRTFLGKAGDTTNINYNELLFIKRMMRNDRFEYRLLDGTIENESSYTSEDGCVKLFVHGFKSAVEHHCAEIIHFLEN